MSDRRGKKQDYTKHEGERREWKARSQEGRVKQVWVWDDEPKHLGHWEKVNVQNS